MMINMRVVFASFIKHLNDGYFILITDIKYNAITVHLFIKRSSSVYEGF